MAGEKFIIVTPARNEANYLAKTIESIASQTILPSEWVIVDDGSVDQTYRIAEEAARSHSWIKVIRLRDRGYRDFGSGLTGAIHKGLDHLSRNDYQYIFNIDADIVLGPNYFQKILSKFAENPKLGIAGGVAYDVINGKRMRIRALPEIIPGAIKCWRRECFEEIGGLVRGLGWDGLDSFKAIMLGWQAKAYEDEELKVLHLRPGRSSLKTKYHGWAMHGKTLHFTGGHPIWLLASAAYHLTDSPVVLGSLCMIIGYLEALLQGAPQYEDIGFRRFLRAYQLKKLARILRLEWMPGV